MQIEITVPLQMNGWEVYGGEFEAMVEIDVTYAGKIASRHSPAESPEWTVKEHKVSCFIKHGENDWIGANDTFRTLIDLYLSSTDGKDWFAGQVYERLMEEN